MEQRLKPSEPKHIQNVLKVSVGDVWDVAILEWRYMGKIEHALGDDENVDDNFIRTNGKRCVCGKVIYRKIHILWNKHTDKYLYVGQSCFDKYYDDIVNDILIQYYADRVRQIDIQFKQQPSSSSGKQIPTHKNKLNNLVQSFKDICLQSTNIIDELRFKIFCAIVEMNEDVKYEEFLSLSQRYVKKYTDLQNDVTIKQFVEDIQYIPEIFESITYTIQSGRFKHHTFRYLQTNNKKYVLQEQIEGIKTWFFSNEDKRQFEFYKRFLRNDIEWYKWYDGDIPVTPPPQSVSFIEDE
jgi:hypothetical protein